MAGHPTPGGGPRTCRGAGMITWDAVGMTELTIAAPRSQLPVYLAVPGRPGPWPGVVVIHDGMGMGQDVRNQADWLVGYHEDSAHDARRRIIAFLDTHLKA